MDYKNFQQAITQAPQIQAPTSNPALGGLFNSTFQLAQSNRGAQGIGGAAAIQGQHDAAVQQASINSQASDIKDKIQAIKDQNDPNKYQKVQKDDGGFDFYDPAGNKINVQQYAQVTGKPVASILKDSQNNIDIQYTQDYKTMQDIANAYANGDKSYLDKLAKDSGDPNFFKGKTAADVMQLFKSGYPNVYGQGTTGGQQLRNVDQAPAFTGAPPAQPAQGQQSPQPGFLSQIGNLLRGQ